MGAQQSACDVSAVASDLPGRRGNPTMTVSTDPRADRELLKVLEPLTDKKGYGPAGKQRSLPISVTSPLWLQRALIGLMERKLTSASMLENWQQVDFPNVEETVEVIKGVDGNDLKLFIAKPTQPSAEPVACVYYLHGGGMAVLSAGDVPFQLFRGRMATRGLVAVSVEFRNSTGKLGSHPFPAALNDCVSGLEWIVNNLKSLGASKLVLCGESGGGNLALATALKLKKDSKINLVNGVYACCPYIAGPQVWASRTSSLPSLEECDHYSGTLNGSAILGRLYDPSHVNATNPLCWPYHASKADLEGLPPHVISVNELDTLRDEGLQYYQKLLDAGVPARSRILQGTVHGTDFIPYKGAENFADSTCDDIKTFADSL